MRPRLFTMLPLLHAVAIAALLAALWLGGPVPAGRSVRSAVLGLASMAGEFMPWLFLPLPAWLLCAIAARSRRTVMAALLPLLLFTGLYAHVLANQLRHVTGRDGPGAAEAVESAPLRVMTFNVGASLREPSGLLAAVERADPDLLLVQELTGDMANVLAPHLALRYPHRALRIDEPVEQGIWSRHPLTGADTWDCPRETAAAARSHYALVRVGERTVHVVNAHPHPPAVRWHRWPSVPFPVILGQVTEGRWAEVDGLARCVEPLLATGQPVILAGDLNLTDTSPEYRRLRRLGLGDAHRDHGLGFGFTFPARPIARVLRRPFPPIPLVRIDYVLHSSNVRVRGVRVWPATGSSDHQPLVADVEV